MAIVTDLMDLSELICCQIVVCSPSEVKGYWNLPEATADAIRNGWLRRGDAGCFDAGRYIYVHARVKDMIISGGENTYRVRRSRRSSSCRAVRRPPKPT
jgi:acyl-CoA synthetase (AMP-forming)/AMP-acid ligase II